MNKRYRDGFAQDFRAATSVMCEVCPAERFKVLRACSVFLKQRSKDLGASSRTAFDVFDLAWAHLEPHWQLSKSLWSFPICSTWFGQVKKDARVCFCNLHNVFARCGVGTIE
jgi:hypothetical protein